MPTLSFKLLILVHYLNMNDKEMRCGHLNKVHRYMIKTKMGKNNRNNSMLNVRNPYYTKDVQ